jgi:hypothetical protein
MVNKEALVWRNCRSPGVVIPKFREGLDFSDSFLHDGKKKA